MRVFKLEARKIVVSENGGSKLLQLPCGVSYSEDAERFSAGVINEETGGWSSRSWSIHKHGAIGAFELAVEAREESLSFLLTRRMLPRIRNVYTIRVVNGLYVVRDPLNKCYRMFATEASAKAFNVAITGEWINANRFNKLTMIQNNYGMTNRAWNTPIPATGNAHAGQFGMNAQPSNYGLH